MIVTDTTMTIRFVSFHSMLAEAPLEDDGIGDHERDDASSSNGDEGNQFRVGYQSSYL